LKDIRQLFHDDLDNEDNSEAVNIDDEEAAVHAAAVSDGAAGHSAAVVSDGAADHAASEGASVPNAASNEEAALDANTGNEAVDIMQEAANTTQEDNGALQGINQE
jgi:hypothetical protein